MTTKEWKRGTLRESILTLSKGEQVYFVQSELKHTRIGPTFWVMTSDFTRIIQVSTDLYGAKCYRLIGDVKSTSKPHEELSTKARTLLFKSVYHPVRRESQTYFFSKTRPDSERLRNLVSVS